MRELILEPVQFPEQEPILERVQGQMALLPERMLILEQVQFPEQEPILEQVQARMFEFLMQAG